MDVQILNTNFSEQGLSKDLSRSWEVHFKPIQTLSIPKTILAAPETIIGAFQFHSNAQ